MRNRLVPVLVVLLLTAGFVRGQVFIKPADVPWETILSGPPAADSDEQRQEIARILEWQNKRTATDVDRCKSEEKPDPFIFSDILGSKFNENSLPVTATLLNDVAGDVKRITKLAKEKWARKRPPAVDARIKPCVALEENGSYPSAHATRGIVWATILGEIFPDLKEKLLDRGKKIGDDRVIAGIHFPSDVEAGKKLGAAIAEQLLKDPAFRASLKAATDECSKSQITK